MPTNVSSSKRRAVGFARAVHAGGCFSGLDVLWRDPSPVHRALCKRIRSFVKSDGLTAVFDALRVGRRNPELFARLSELTAVLTSLGCSASPYSKVFTGYDVTKDRSLYPELEPYRDLDPSRLLLYGKGQWDITDFLSDELVMAYREPESIKVDRTPASWEYPRIRKSEETVAQLALLWDRHGLLRLRRERATSRPSYELVRVFNCYKASDRDRQIGDRRGRNAVEGVLRGPSSNLPAGQDLCDLYIDLSRQKLRVSISDRRDFYHQLWVTKSRAITNTLGPGLPPSLIEDSAAYQVFLHEQACRRYSREKHGDKLGFAAGVGTGPDTRVWACFNSILQGDHGGVEMATDAHSRLLCSYGLPRDDVRLVANKPCFDMEAVEGLVIDDFFCVSIDEQNVSPTESRSFAAYTKAQQAYDDFKLLG